MLNFLRHEVRPDPYRGAVLGLLGGVLGTLAMGQYWVRVSPLLTPDSGSSDDSSGREEEEQPRPDQNVISPFGQQHEPGESSTAAMGRLAYQAINGKVPGEQTRAALSEGVHWGFGLLSGAVFGALTARHSSVGATPLTGAVFGALLWAGNDEGVVPLLGLQDGPAASPVSGHLNRLGAHLFYGAALGLGLWVLNHVMPETD